MNFLFSELFAVITISTWKTSGSLVEKGISPFISSGVKGFGVSLFAVWKNRQAEQTNKSKRKAAKFFFEADKNIGESVIGTKSVYK